MTRAMKKVTSSRPNMVMATVVSSRESTRAHRRSAPAADDLRTGVCVTAVMTRLRFLWLPGRFGQRRGAKQERAGTGHGEGARRGFGAAAGLPPLTGLSS